MRWGSGGETGTLLAAARKAVTEFNIVANGHGGLVSRDLEMAMLALELMIEKEEKKTKGPQLVEKVDESCDPR